jgi:alkylglycerol monooxygenase
LPGKNLIALAVPFFFVFIGVELLVARARRRHVYRVGDAIGDLGCGIAQQAAYLFTTAAFLAVYAAIFDRFRVTTLDARTPWPWLLSFVFVDVAYYWWHRLSHEVNVLWAGHVVHHQSEDYNLAVALRQAVATGFTSLPFYLPMAVLGVPPVVQVTMVSLSTLYQFWIHTELVGKLGWLERVFNTPSHHRVHHAVNPQYLDKNYAATLIVWDKLFGTFAEEREQPVYGTVKPFGSFNPVWAQVAYWVELWKKARHLPRRRDRWLLWLRSPTWVPAGETLELPDPAGRAKYDPAIPFALKVYAIVQFVPVVVALFLAMLAMETLPFATLAGVCVLVYLALGTLGGLLDGRRWAIPAELARLGVTAVAVAAWGAGHTAPIVAVVLAAVPSALLAAWLLWKGRPALDSAPAPFSRSSRA